MRRIFRWGAGPLALLLAAPTCFAQQWVTPVFRTPYPIAPSAYGPGFYSQPYPPCGMVYGPNYYLRPPFMPFNGILPGPQGQAIMSCWNGQLPRPPQGPQGPQGPQAGTPNMPFPHHPFARGPRDFFMWNEAMEDQRGRLATPLFVP